MADLEKHERPEEEERLIEGMAVLDFDMLCSTVAMQTQGKWRILENVEERGDEESIDFGGVLRMWEGEVVLDCFDNRRIALESACCPCYRFGKNMRRAGFGSCFLQGAVYFILVVGVLVNFLAFTLTKRHCFLYLALAFTVSIGAYLGFFRAQIKRKFNIRGNDSFLDDCFFHLVCPCCTLSQESRTLEMNNVQEGTWRGRGDTICVGSYYEGSKALFELHPSPHAPTKSPEPCSMQKSPSVGDNTAT